MISSQISFPWNTFLIRVVLPTILTIILFISGFFFVIIPAVEENIMDRKREMIRELTNSAWNILAKFENDEHRGLITRRQAQDHVIEQIRNLHYGQGMKDYFWINDMHPRMIIHPYRTDLNGTDLTNYTDPDGKHVFLEFVKVIEARGSGYVNYKWQSIDNANLIVPKISYVKGFAPWGWIIGTGVYIEDVKAEIGVIINSIIKISIIIFAISMALLLSIIRQSYIAHKKKRKTEDELRKTQSTLFMAEKLASLGRLSAMVAHEINNPLSGVLSYSKLSTRYLEQENITPAIISSVKDNLRIIANETKRCGDIVRNLLQFAKQSLGEVKDVNLNEIITVSTRILEHSVKMSNLELITELCDRNDVLQCDAGAIQQIVIALVVNSIESSSPGKKIIVRTDCTQADQVRIIVTDYGAGIRPVDLPHIFDPFFSTKESNRSMGLGLSTVYGIIQRHSGTINVDSVPREGSVFTVTLPRVQNVPPAEE